jgi:AbrB family looped-hinge helix DNA binding protein
MTGISTITSKGQTTIPVSIRDYFGLQPGSKVVFEVDKSQKTISIRPVKSVVAELFGSMSTKIPYVPIEVARQKAGELLGKKYGLKNK